MIFFAPCVQLGHATFFRLKSNSMIFFCTSRAATQQRHWNASAARWYVYKYGSAKKTNTANRNETWRRGHLISLGDLSLCMLSVFLLHSSAAAHTCSIILS
jgi:hypothetical protein